MNHFRVNPERAAEFEAGWRARESHLQQFAGFRGFALLKGDEPGDYASHTTWDSRESFLAWVQSDAFRASHSQRSPEGVLLGHPQAKFYSAVIEEPAATR